jgi:hypothetical protein
MRYHKAIEITRVEADFIIEGGGTPLAQSDVVVISRGDRYYDVRSMSKVEVEAFVNDLVRAEHAAQQERHILPC